MCSDPRPVKREECGPDLVPLRVLHRLIKMGKQGLREAVAPKEAFFKSGTEPPGRDLAHAAARPTKKEEGGSHLLPLSIPLGVIKGLQNEVDHW